MKKWIVALVCVVLMVCAVVSGAGAATFDLGAATLSLDGTVALRSELEQWTPMVFEPSLTVDGNLTIPVPVVKGMTFVGDATLVIVPLDKANVDLDLYAMLKPLTNLEVKFGVEQSFDYDAFHLDGFDPYAVVTYKLF